MYYYLIILKYRDTFNNTVSFLKHIHLKIKLTKLINLHLYLYCNIKMLIFLLTIIALFFHQTFYISRNRIFVIVLTTLCLCVWYLQQPILYITFTFCWYELRLKRSRSFQIFHYLPNSFYLKSFRLRVQCTFQSNK